MEISDAVVLLIIIISAVIGLIKGFVRELVAIIALVGGLVLAFYFSSVPAQWVPAMQWFFFNQEVDSHDVSFIISFITIVVGTLIVGHLLGAGISRIVVMSGTGNIDRFLGLVFGITRGGVVIILLVAIAGLTKLPLSDVWKRSELLPMFETFAHFTVMQLPTDYSNYFSFPSVHR